jgi:hypothetical protein
MLVGHLAVAFLAKRADPALPLGTLVLAAMLPDLLWPVFTAAGLERVAFGSGLGAGNYFQAIDITMSHSLATGAVWAVLLAAIVATTASRRSVWLVVALVLSHWVLDVVSHRPDVPLAPGLPVRLGLGLWTSIPATILVEGGLWLAAIVVYARATRPTGRAGTYVFWAAIPLITLIWYNNIAGPPPPNPSTAPLASLVLFAFVVCWAFLVNRLRPPPGLS